MARPGGGTGPAGSPPRRLRTALPLIAAAAALPALDAGCAAAATALAGPAGPALLGAAFNLAAALRFAATLRPGREPLIARYSRFDPAGPPDADGAYTRRLTAAWAAVLGAFALACAAAAVGAWPAALVGAVQAPACAALFLGEHAWRNRRFPQLGRATPLRTLRAIRLAHSGGARAPAHHAA